LLHHEAADADVPGAVVGLRPNHRHVGQGAVGDPLLGAVQHPLGPHLLRGGAHAAGVGAEVRLGEAEAADRLAGREAGDPAVLLLLRAEGVDRVHDQRALHGDEAAQAGITALQLLHDEAVGDAAQAGKTVFGDAGTEKVEGAHGGHQLERGAAVAVAFFDDRLDLVIDERAHRVAHQPLLFAEERIQLQKIDAWETAQSEASLSSRYQQDSAGVVVLETLQTADGSLAAGTGRGRHDTTRAHPPSRQLNSPQCERALTKRTSSRSGSARRPSGSSDATAKPSSSSASACAPATPRSLTNVTLPASWPVSL